MMKKKESDNSLLLKSSPSSRSSLTLSEVSLFINTHFNIDSEEADDIEVNVTSIPNDGEATSTGDLNGDQHWQQARDYVLEQPANNDQADFRSLIGVDHANHVDDFHQCNTKIEIGLNDSASADQSNEGQCARSGTIDSIVDNGETFGDNVNSSILFDDTRDLNFHFEHCANIDRDNRSEQHQMSSGLLAHNAFRIEPINNVNLNRTQFNKQTNIGTDFGLAGLLTNNHQSTHAKMFDQNGNRVEQDKQCANEGKVVGKCEPNTNATLNAVGHVEFLERYRNRNSSQRPLFNESFSSTKSSVPKIDTKISVLESGPENESLPERGQWSGKLDFIFSCISYAVGLGNVWRFPYLCYENGGGVFLVPYLICALIIGVPLFLMEVSLGQYFHTGGVAIWNRIPMLKGVGIASMVMIGLCNTYYIIIIAWTLHYLFNAFKSPLPWSGCTNDWNTEYCHSDNITNTTTHTVSSAQEYWERKVLQISSDMLEVGSIQWELLLALIVGWILVYGVIYRGIHQSGKIIWFTAMFPYLILIILFGYGMSLEGAMDGIHFYLLPRWEMLKESKVWVAAGTQLLFTYGIGIGTNIALGSYNTHNHNFFRDSLIACTLSSGTSLFSGFVIFSVLGHMAFSMNTTVDAVATSGPGLAFIVYPEAVAKLPMAQFWAVLFFIMLLVLGIDSQFCTVESFITGIVDEFPRLLRPHRKLFTLSIVVLHFVLGITMITSGGMYIFQLMDNFSASGITLIIVVLCEILAFAWIYGGGKIYKNMHEMLGFRPTRLLYYVWLYVSPACLLAILIFSIIQYKAPTYARKPFPWYGELLGWIISMSSILCIPLYVIYYLFYKSNQKLSFKERFVAGLHDETDLPVVDCKPNFKNNNNNFVDENSLEIKRKLSQKLKQNELESSCSESTLSTSMADQSPVINQ